MPFFRINNNNASNFLKDIYMTNNLICFYYWNSCGHCQTFKPIFYDVIRELKERDEMDNMIILEVEYDDFDLLPEKLRDINAFPSVISYSNGEKTDEFKDQRTPPNLEKFILSSLKPSKSSTLKPVSNSSKPRTIKTLKKYT